MENPNPPLNQLERLLTQLRTALVGLTKKVEESSEYSRSALEAVRLVAKDLERLVSQESVEHQAITEILRLIGVNAIEVTKASHNIQEVRKDITGQHELLVVENSDAIHIWIGRVVVNVAKHRLFPWIASGGLVALGHAAWRWFHG